MALCRLIVLVGVVGYWTSSRSRQKIKDDRQADRHAKLGQKKKKNGKSANGKSSVQETKKLTDEQTDI